MRKTLVLAALVAAPALALAYGKAQPAQGAATAAEQKPAAAAPAVDPSARKVEIAVTEAGFEPQEIKVKKGQPVTLVFTRKTDRTCITAVDIPDEGVKKLKLPLDKAAAVTITPKKAGVEKFHCTAMAMGDGKIVVEE